MRFARSPYPFREFVSMARRRFSPPPPRPDAPGRLSLRLAPEAPAQWVGFTGDISPLPAREARYDPEVQAFFADCDVIVGNLEGVVTSQRWAPFLHKHTPHIFEHLARLAEPARWVLSLANNHATDFGARDLARTVGLIEAQGMRHVGTREAGRVELVRGVTLTAWTWWVNGETDLVLRRDPGAPAGPGLHVALPHWGYEHERAPRADQRARIPEGYALVVGHHSHLPQPLEQLADGRLVAWSLGNFLTAKRLPVLGEGALFKVGLAGAQDGTPRIVRAEFQHVELVRTPAYCRVVPLEEALAPA